MVRRRPQNGAGVRLEGDDARVLPSVHAADVRDDAAVLDQRRSRGTEESLADLKPARGVHAPDALPGCEIDRVQLSLRAEGVDASLRDHGDRPRAFVEPEVVPVTGGVRVTPPRIARPRVERFDDLFVPDAVKQDEPIAGDDWAGEALPDRFAPDFPRTACGPRRGQRWTAVDAVALGTEKLRPVVRGNGHSEHDKATAEHRENAETGFTGEDTENEATETAFRGENTENEATETLRHRENPGSVLWGCVPWHLANHDITSPPPSLVS